MAEQNKKPEINKPKFSAYWIYALVILIFFGIQLFGGGSWNQPAKTTQSEFENYLKNGDVEKVEVINKKVAKVFLTKEARDKEIHTKNKPKNFMAPGTNDPAYEFEFGDLQNFENNFNKNYKSRKYFRRKNKEKPKRKFL